MIHDSCDQALRSMLTRSQQCTNVLNVVRLYEQASSAWSPRQTSAAKNAGPEGHQRQLIAYQACYSEACPPALEYSDSFSVHRTESTLVEQESLSSCADYFRQFFHEGIV